MEVISDTQRQVLVAGASLGSREGGYHLNHCPLCRAFLGLDFGGGLFFTTFRAAFCACEFRHESPSETHTRPPIAFWRAGRSISSWGSLGVATEVAVSISQLNDVSATLLAAGQTSFWFTRGGVTVKRRWISPWWILQGPFHPTRSALVWMVISGLKGPTRTPTHQESKEDHPKHEEKGPPKKTPPNQKRDPSFAVLGCLVELLSHLRGKVSRLLGDPVLITCTEKRKFRGTAPSDLKKETLFQHPPNNVQNPKYCLQHSGWGLRAEASTCVLLWQRSARSRFVCGMFRNFCEPGWFCEVALASFISSETVLCVFLTPRKLLTRVCHRPPIHTCNATATLAASSMLRAFMDKNAST